MSDAMANPLIGQGEEFSRLLRAARSRRMHHGLLIAGPVGGGKTTAALRIAQALLCPSDRSDEPCGSCRVCVHVGSHADLHRLEIPDDKDEIPVDLVRQLRDSLMRLPVEGRARVVILDPADRLNIQGQNSLLKTLEEPGRDTFLLLPTSRPEGLLDTVRSRVATLRVLPLDPAALRRRLADLLPGAAAARLDQAVDLAAGSVGQGLALLDEENRPILELLEGLLAGLTPEATPVTVARAALQGVVGRIPSVARATTVLWMLRTLLRKELWTALATDNTGPYAAETSVRCTQAIESLIDAESDLALRIPPEQVLTAALFRVIPHVA